MLIPIPVGVWLSFTAKGKRTKEFPGAPAICGSMAGGLAGWFGAVKFLGFFHLGRLEEPLLFPSLRL